MGFKYRRPALKIGDVRIKKNKKGFSISSKTLTGGRKTYNTHTGKTTKTYKTGIKGLSYTSTTGGWKSQRRTARTRARSASRPATRIRWGVIIGLFVAAGIIFKYFIYILPIVIIGALAYFFYTKKKSEEDQDDSELIEIGEYEDSDEVVTENEEYSLTDENEGVVTEQEEE